jgi:hypothetical protein
LRGWRLLALSAQEEAEEADPAYGIPDHDQLLSAHWGRHKLTVQVDLLLDVFVGRTWGLAVGHTRKADPRW